MTKSLNGNTRLLPTVSGITTKTERGLAVGCQTCIGNLISKIIPKAK